MAVRGGNRLRGRLDRLARDLRRPMHLRAGFLAGATYPDGTPVAYVAALNEFGVPLRNQPPRPFLRDTVAVETGKWVLILGRRLERGHRLGTALRFVGEIMVSDIRDAINHFDDPALAPATIEKKGFPKPLIETGHMRDSVDYEVSTR